MPPWAYLAAAALIIVLYNASLCWLAVHCNSKFPHKEMRIVTVDHKSNRRIDGLWKPVSHSKILYEEISDLREHGNGTRSYSFEYR